MNAAISLEQRRVRRAVLDILSCGRPMTLAEIAFAAERHMGLTPTPFEIETALSELAGKGHPIQRDHNGVADEYRLDHGPGGHDDGGSAA